jgi:hypothetical protein
MSRSMISNDTLRSGQAMPAKKVAPLWQASSASTAAREAARRIAPLWPLRHFVAANPFLGMTGDHFTTATERLGRVAPGGLRMDLAFYREKMFSGEITDHDLEAARLRAMETPGIDPAFWVELKPTLLRLALFQPASEERLPQETLTLAETFDRIHGTAWHSALTESVADFCAAYFDQGQSAWRMPWQGESLYTAWKEAGAIDRKPEMLGLKRFRARVRNLPADSADSIAASLNALRIDSVTAPDYLHRLLLSIRGWAGYVQYLVRETEMRGGQDDRLLELLAIRISLDAALLEIATIPDLIEFWPPAHRMDDGLSESTAIRHVLQLALEHSWERQVRSALDSNRSRKCPPTLERPDVQAVFCIDVRSEILRRALEASSPGIQTRGFAGFFGLPIEYRPMEMDKGQAQCPVLLLPQAVVHECHHDHAEDVVARRKLGIAKRFAHGWSAFKTSAISCFSFVETAGLLFGGSLLRDGLLPGRPKSKHEHQHRGPSLDYGGGIPAEARPAMAFGMLKNMGLTGGFARLVLLCGHGSETKNNPYASGLDCGACGGHAGDANARVGASLLNDPGVRAALAQEHGIEIPRDTWFLAGLHNTTTDDVTLFDLHHVPSSHSLDVDALRSHLDRASAASRRERSNLLGLSPADPEIDSQVRSRAADWSQVRPEWGLAGNAAFIAAPRARSAGANLGGRVFLHEYDHHADTDNSVLELIMAAPMVVANWINLQYYASTVNNAVFGSGNKVLHNVVGTLGVCLGNGGDLETGLPFQSVHDGTKFIHEPIRLHVFLEAPTNRIDAVLAKHANVRELVENGWLLIFAIADEGRMQRYLGRGAWEDLESE